MTAEPIVAFLRARLDEDEMKAEDASSIQAGKSWRGWRYDLIGSAYEDGDEPVGAVKLAAVGHVARHDPDRVFRDIEADRKLIARYEYCVRMGDCPGNEDLDVARQEYEDHIFPLRAARFSDHPEYAALGI